MSINYLGPDTVDWQGCQAHPDDTYCYCNAQPGNCYNDMRSKCSQGYNAAQDYTCSNWLSAYCTSDTMGDPMCKTYAKSPAAKGQIDQTMKKYCSTSTGAADDLCSCINSPIGFCANKFDKNCITKNGYETYDMITTQCPDYLSCDQQVNLSTAAMAALMDVGQNCSVETNSTIDKLKQPLGNEFTAPAILANNRIISIIYSWPLYIYVILFLLILLIVAALTGANIINDQ